MSSKNSCNVMRASLYSSICLIGVLSLFAMPANAQHVHQLLYDNYIWIDQSLSGEPALQNGSGANWNNIGAFTTTPNNQLHIYYVGADSHVHQRTQSQKLKGSFNLPVWVDEDLTQETGAESITYGTSLAAFSVGNLQYVFYLPGSEGDIHMLSYDNSQWTDQDISVAAGNPGAAFYDNGVIVAFTTTPNDQMHVYYRGGNYEVRQLFFNGVSWGDENLTAESGGSSSYGAWWAGFSIANYQYIFYADLNFHVHELYYNNEDWTDVDLSSLIGAPEIGLSLTAFVVPGTQTMEVFYDTEDDHIYQMSSSDNEHWAQQDLTMLTNGLPVDPFVPITGFATTPNDQFHVYYISDAHHVTQLFFNGSSWSNTDLTSQTHAGNALDLTGMAGLSLGNYQYVYYVGK